jgi:AcrR family transcriptional regulator
VRRRLYEVAIGLFAARGYEEATLRQVAARAHVSPSLLYRYFPNKRAVVLAFYEDLSEEFARRVVLVEEAPWAERALGALETSLRILRPHREVLKALVPVLVSAGPEGLFAEQTAFSRLRVQGVFEAAVRGAADAPSAGQGEALGRLLYLGHLGVLLFWLLDRSPGQKATARLVSLLGKGLNVAALAFAVFPVEEAIAHLDGLLYGALVDGAGSGEAGTVAGRKRQRDPRR